MKVQKLCVFLLLIIVISSCGNYRNVSPEDLFISYLDVDKNSFTQSLEDTLYIRVSILNRNVVVNQVLVADSRYDSVAPYYFPLPQVAEDLIVTDGYSGAMIIPVPLTSVRPYYYPEDTFHYNITVLGPEDTSNTVPTEDLRVHL